MSRKRANKAEAIVRGIGAMFTVIVLFIATQGLPGMLKGRSTDEMMRTVIGFIAAFAALGIIVGTISLIVWITVKKRGN
jgi:hypothetical protein